MAIYDSNNQATESSNYTIDGLKEAANVVATETTSLHNSAPRIGGLFGAIIDFFASKIADELATEIVNRDNAIDTEAATRSNADATLQSSIDALTARVTALESSVSDHATSIGTIQTSLPTKVTYIEMYKDFSVIGQTIDRGYLKGSSADEDKEAVTLPTEPFIFTGNYYPINKFALYSSDGSVSGFTEGVYYLFKSPVDDDTLYFAYKILEISDTGYVAGSVILAFYNSWTESTVPNLVLTNLNEQWQIDVPVLQTRTTNIVNAMRDNSIDFATYSGTIGTATT